MQHFVFCDCFDTVLKRKVPSKKILYLWSEKMLSAFPDLTAEELYRMYISAEQRLCKYYQKENIYIFDEIIDVIINRCTIYGYKVVGDVADIKKQALTEYVKIEKNNTYANAKVINKLIRFKRNGCKIFLISDFYCGKDVICDLLKNAKIDDLFDKVYVSCDEKKSKSKTDLYTYILTENNIKPTDAIMIGDNQISDYNNAKSVGISAIKVKPDDNSLSCLDREKIYGSLPKIKLNKEIKKIFYSKAKYNYSNYAFTLFLFTRKLVEKLQENKTSDVYFLSREGKYLKKLFDLYCEQKSIDIKSYYLEMSRNSVFNASLKKLEDEDFKYIVKELKQISPHDFFATLQLGENVIDDLQKSLTTDFNKKLNYAEMTEFIKELKQNKKFVKIYNELRESQSKAFNKYLAKMGIDKRQNITIVDVGWKGTMQDCLNKYFGGKKQITGYYIGYNGAKGDLSESNKKYGLLYSTCPFDNSLIEKINEHYIIYLEEFLRADHNRIIAYSTDGNPVYDEKSNEHKIYEKYIKEMQDEILCKFNQLAKLDDEKTSEEQLLNAHMKMKLKTSIRDINWIFTVEGLFEDSFARIGKARKFKTFSDHNRLRFYLSCMKFYLKWRMNKL